MFTSHSNNMKFEQEEPNFLRSNKCEIKKESFLKM